MSENLKLVCESMFIPVVVAFINNAKLSEGPVTKYKNIIALIMLSKSAALK